MFIVVNIWGQQVLYPDCLRKLKSVNVRPMLDQCSASPWASWTLLFAVIILWIKQPQTNCLPNLWKLSIQRRQNGSKRLPMPMGFIVLNVGSHQVRLNLCGLIADRLSISRIINANGKSFIIANVSRLGGLGAMIVRHRNLAIAKSPITMTTI